MTERVFAVAHWADQMVLVLLLLLSLMSLLLIVERYFVLREASGRSLRVRKKIEEAVSSRNLSSIRDLATDASSMEGRALSLSLDRYSRGTIDGVGEIFASVGAIEKPKLEKSLAFLATVGSNAPYIGLFGTVLGIMKAFNDMAQSANGQQTVMAGISSALIATAAGLLVAIPAVLAYNYFQRQVRLIMGNLDTSRDVFLAWAMGENGGGDGGVNAK